MDIIQITEEPIEIVIILETQLVMKCQELQDGRMIKLRENLRLLNKHLINKRQDMKFCKVKPLPKQLEHENLKKDAHLDFI